MRLIVPLRNWAGDTVAVAPKRIVLNTPTVVAEVATVPAFKQIARDAVPVYANTDFPVVLSPPLFAVGPNTVLPFQCWKDAPEPSDGPDVSEVLCP